MEEYFQLEQYEARERGGDGHNSDDDDWQYRAFYQLHEAVFNRNTGRNQFQHTFCECAGSFRRIPGCPLSAQILRVCRQFYDEGVDLLYGNNRFLVYDLASLHRRMVRTMTPAALERIRWIGFTYQSSSSYKSDYHKFRTPATDPYSYFIPDLSCWYPLRNLNRVDWFLSASDLPREMERMCYEIEYTARLMASQLSQARNPLPRPPGRAPLVFCCCRRPLDLGNADHGSINCKVFGTPKFLHPHEAIPDPLMSEANASCHQRK
jgi:hypothetical protein